MVVQRGERGRAGNRVAAVGAAETARMHGVEQVGAAGDRGSGMPPAMPFAMVTRSGTTPSCSQANQAPVRAKPVCTSSAMKTTPLRLAHSARAGRNPGAGTMNPPSPWIGSMMIAATESAPELLLDPVDRAQRGLLTG